MVEEACSTITKYTADLTMGLIWKELNARGQIRKRRCLAALRGSALRKRPAGLFDNEELRVQKEGQQPDTHCILRRN